MHSSQMTLGWTCFGSVAVETVDKLLYLYLSAVESMLFKDDYNMRTLQPSSQNKFHLGLKLMCCSGTGSPRLSRTKFREP